MVVLDVPANPSASSSLARGLFYLLIVVGPWIVVGVAVYLLVRALRGRRK